MKVKLKRNQIIFFSIILLFCIFAIGEAVYVQFFSKDQILNIVTSNNPTDANVDYEELKNNFNSIFYNNIETNDYDINLVERKDANKELVYTSYEKDEKSDGKYEVKVNIPTININNQIIDKTNQEINNIFGNKVNSILSQEQIKTVYSVQYQSFINNDILSIIIQSTLKEGENAQRVIIKTYNYNLKTSKLMSFDDIIKEKNLNKEDISNVIIEEIKRENEQAKALKELGYSVFNRDLTGDMYEVENIDNFFIDKNGKIYIIYAYGNTNYTSEMDLVVL